MVDGFEEMDRTIRSLVPFGAEVRVGSSGPDRFRGHIREGEGCREGLVV